MSKLDDLIRELCPHGIKYTELRDVCDFQNGFSFKSALFKEIGLPILRITNIQDGNISASDYVFFDREDYKESLDRYKVKKEILLLQCQELQPEKLDITITMKLYILINE